jgi:hypothetical protein
VLAATAGSVLAVNTPASPVPGGQTLTTSEGNPSNGFDKQDQDPQTCGSGLERTAHFILNQLDPDDQAALIANGGVPVTASYTLPPDPTVHTTAAVGFEDQGSHVDVFIPIPDNAHLVSASFTVPSTIPGGTLAYGEFNLSHVECIGGTGPGPNPQPGATPELSSVALFGSGALGLVGYAVARYRARRKSAA